MRKTFGIIGAENSHVKYPECQQAKFFVGILWKRILSCEPNKNQCPTAQQSEKNFSANHFDRVTADAHVNDFVTCMVGGAENSAATFYFDALLHEDLLS
jgi:hypothetical protein